MLTMIIPQRSYTGFLIAASSAPPTSAYTWPPSQWPTWSSTILISFAVPIFSFRLFSSERQCVSSWGLLSPEIKASHVRRPWNISQLQSVFLESFSLLGKARLLAYGWDSEAKLGGTDLERMVLLELFDLSIWSLCLSWELWFVSSVINK